MARLARGLPQKQDGIKIVTRAPSGADGKAGDMRLLASSSVEGAVLYVKSGNKWFPFQSGLDTSTPAKKLFEEDGYQYFDSGLIIQWGREGSTTANALDDTQDVTFPIAFPNECFSVQATYGMKPDDEEGLGTNIGINYDQLSATGVQFSTFTSYEFVYWMAIGH